MFTAKGAVTEVGNELPGKAVAQLWFKHQGQSKETQREKTKGTEFRKWPMQAAARLVRVSILLPYSGSWFASGLPCASSAQKGSRPPL